MPEVLRWFDCKCQGPAMAMHRMQNMQFLSDSGEECCKFFSNALMALAQFLLTAFIVSERCLCSDTFTAECCLLVLCRLHLIFLHVWHISLYVCVDPGWDALLRLLWQGFPYGVLWPTSLQNAKRYIMLLFASVDFSILKVKLLNVPLHKGFWLRNSKMICTLHPELFSGCLSLSLTLSPSLSSLFLVVNDFAAGLQMTVLVLFS